MVGTVVGILVTVVVGIVVGRVVGAVVTIVVGTVVGVMVGVGPEPLDTVMYPERERPFVPAAFETFSLTEYKPAFT